MTSALARGTRAAPAPAELGLPADPLSPDGAADAHAHVRARVDAQLRALLSHQDGTRAGRDPEELHQFRVAIRRLRSLLKTTELFGDGGRAVRTELGWLGEVTGPIRDLDVLLVRVGDSLDELTAEDRAAAQPLLDALKAERARHRRTLGRALSGRRYRALLERTAGLLTAADGGPAALPDVEGTHLVASIRKPARKLTTAVDALADDPEDAALHSLRILVKRLRYAAETATGSARKKDAARLRELVSACKDLQDVLGEHQDAVVAVERITALVDDLAGHPRAAFVAGRLVERELARRTALRAAWPAKERTVRECAAGF